jgi:hypothetical protein
LEAFNMLASSLALNNENDFTGPGPGHEVNIEVLFTMMHNRPVPVDGPDSISGFNPNVVFIREVAD